MFKTFLIFGFALALIALGSPSLAHAAPRRGEPKVYYYLHDHLGGISAVTDEDGNVVERRDYLPFGEDRLIEELDLNEDDLATLKDKTDYGFTGKEQDPETELYYYGARYYDPMIGRFISQDPWEGDLTDPQSWNKYSYVLNNPLRYIDPTGMVKETTGETEDGDGLTSIADEYSGIFDTTITYQELMILNPHLKNADKIQVGDIVLMGTIGENGEIWTVADPRNFDAAFRASLNEKQKKILDYQRNYYQRDLPQNISEIDWSEWEDLGEAVAHNIGTSGNRDLRGKGARAGQQAIYDLDGNLVTTPENMGTFDFVSYKNSIEHSNADVRPWIDRGNSSADTTTSAQRLGALGIGLLMRYFINPFIPTAQ